MDTAAIVMLLFGAVFLWGGVTVAAVHYYLAAKRDPG
ncbi:MAG TPA: MetS family NSS transporter small subunit [Jiangellales bacterium]|nr:MetS family NSS transporter small subunit [Jiangellales bacterium]